MRNSHGLAYLLRSRYQISTNMLRQQPGGHIEVEVCNESSLDLVVEDQSHSAHIRTLNVEIQTLDDI
jgi:hypothetical protein